MRKRDNVHKKKALRRIYVLVFSDNGFFINHTTQKNMRDVYKDHYNLKWSWSKKQMAADKEKGYIPKMFILEEDFESTKAEVFSRLVAWSKLLVDAGYICTNGETFVSYIEDFVERTQGYYDEIKNADLEKLLADRNNLFPNYGARNRPKPEPEKYHTLRFKISESDYERLLFVTDTYGDLVSDFCEECVVDAVNYYYKELTNKE